MDQRKKRESHSSQRKGRLKIIARKTDSRIPFGFDLWVSELRQFGHVMVILASGIQSRKVFSRQPTAVTDELAVPHAPVMHVFGMAIRIQPRQEGANAAVGQRDA